MILEKIQVGNYRSIEALELSPCGSFNVLIGKKLVLQVADNLDRRRKRLRLSAEGQKVVKRLEKQRTQHNDWLLSGYEEREKLTVIKFMKSFLLTFDQPMGKKSKGARSKKA